MKKVHIALMGKEIIPIYLGILKAEPDEIHLLSTEQTKQDAEHLRDLLGKKTLIYPVDPYDPLNIKTRCQLVRDSLKDCQVSYNLTGGTKIMALAAYSVAIEYKDEIGYITVPSDINSKAKYINLVDFTTTILKLPISTESLVELKQQKIKSLEKMDSIDTNLLENAKRIQRFIYGYETRKIYVEISKAYRKEANSSCLPRDWRPKSWIQVEHGSDSLTVYDLSNQKECLTLDVPQPVHLFLDGRWWEVLVADCIWRWIQREHLNYEVLRNVVFESKSDKEKDKNEVDILLNLGAQLLFVECKSGTVTMDNINKINAVRRTYGGDMAKAILVTYRSIFPDIADKANDAQIYVIGPDTGRNEYMNIHKLEELLPNKLEEYIKQRMK